MHSNWLWQHSHSIYKPSQGIHITFTTSKTLPWPFKGTLMAFTTLSRPLQKSECTLTMISCTCVSRFCFVTKFCVYFCSGKNLNPSVFTSVGKFETEFRAFSACMKGSEWNFEGFSLLPLPWRVRNGIPTVFSQNI
jgi:hypothetical protein